MYKTGKAQDLPQVLPLDILHRNGYEKKVKG
jgi:hypothetical protein|nr:MAG TPA: hypothetical protein [Caudoviricetes sp.]DAO78602.1 MAG TPA: hypothetical protein [Caudoviricetes sp.]